MKKDQVVALLDELAAKLNIKFNVAEAIGLGECLDAIREYGGEKSLDMVTDILVTIIEAQSKKEKEIVCTLPKKYSESSAGVALL